MPDPVLPQAPRSSRVWRLLALALIGPLLLGLAGCSPTEDDDDTNLPFVDVIPVEPDQRGAVEIQYVLRDQDGRFVDVLGDWDEMVTRYETATQDILSDRLKSRSCSPPPRAR